MGFNSAIIKKSFNAIKPRAAELADQFFSELLRLHPEAASGFKQTKDPQEWKGLVGSFSHAIEHIDRPDHTSQYLRKIGEKHFKGGARPEYFVWAGEALLATLQNFLGNQWNEELEHNWIDAYTYLVSEIKKGQTIGRNENRIENLELHEEMHFIEKTANKIVCEMLSKAISHEMNGEEFQKKIRDSASAMLKLAVEAEARSVLSSIKKI